LILTDHEYANIVELARKGKLLIGIDRGIARSVFTAMPLEMIYERTGEKPYLEKAVVSGLFLSSIAALLASFVFSWFAFSFWSIALIPVIAIIFFFWVGQNILPNKGVWGVSIILAGLMGAGYFQVFPSNDTAMFAICLAAAVWFMRLSYVIATVFLRMMVLRNKQAFEWIEPQIGQG